MATIAPRTLWQRTARLWPAINWEMHVLQSGLDRLLCKRPWIGVPTAGTTLALAWLLYWLALPLVIVLCLITRAMHPIELYFRRSP